MEPRTANILKAVVREFIRSGEPVSSDWLYENYDFGIKPAMIRLELGSLTAAGFLLQPHIAAGRIPSDKGYEFYVQSVLAENAPRSKPELFSLFRERAWREFLVEFSKELDILAAASVLPQRILYKSMLTEFIDTWEWPMSELRGIIRDFESLDERIDKLPRVAGDEIQVFIGRKSPITKSENLAVMTAAYDCGRQKVLVCAIGPKRMDYEKTAGIMKGLKQAAGINLKRKG
jgi:transcriptional regulator of heat shock response